MQLRQNWQPRQRVKLAPSVRIRGSFEEFIGVVSASHSRSPRIRSALGCETEPLWANRRNTSRGGVRTRFETEVEASTDCLRLIRLATRLMPSVSCHTMLTTESRCSDRYRSGPQDHQQAHDQSRQRCYDERVRPANGELDDPHEWRGEMRLWSADAPGTERCAGASRCIAARTSAMMATEEQKNLNRLLRGRLAICFVISSTRACKARTLG